MSKRIFQAFLSDPGVPDAGTEAEDDEEPAKSGDSSSDSEGQSSYSEGQPWQSPLKSSKAKGQTGKATEEFSASDADDQQTPASVTAKRQAPGILMYFCLFLL